MSLDKYGTGQDPYGLENSNTLTNALGISSEKELQDVELQLTEIAAK